MVEIDDSIDFEIIFTKNTGKLQDLLIITYKLKPTYMYKVLNVLLIALLKNG